MSCWREQHVLRMPATTIGIYTKEEWEEFYSKLCKKTDWSAGSFAPALCSYFSKGISRFYSRTDGRSTLL